MRKIMLLATGCFMLSVTGVAALYWVSSGIRQTPGSFLRLYPPHPVVLSATYELPDDKYYLAGATDHTVYLANRRRPLTLLTFNAQQRDSSSIHLSLQAPQRLSYFRITVTVDSPHFYFIDGSIPYYYRGMLGCPATNILPANVYFDKAAPMSSGSFGMSTISARTKQSVLAKKMRTDSTAKLKYDLLESQGLNHFSVDGDIQFNPALNRFVFLYYYRNEYFITDSSLNLLHRAHTIDTFSRAQVKADTLHAHNRIALSAPPPIINKQFATSGKLLYVHSLVPARNENMKRFDDVAVIDVYDLTKQQYMLSFQLPKPEGKNLTGFTVTDKHLYALFKNTLHVHDLAGSVLKQLLPVNDTSQDNVPSL